VVDPGIPELATRPELPVATPLPEAISAGVFGLTDAGPMQPNAEDVAAILSEHAIFTARVLLDLLDVQRCAERGLNFRTGRRANGSAAEWSAEATRRELDRLKALYAGCLSSCLDAFGFEAATRFDAYVRSLLSPDGQDLKDGTQTETVRTQRTLF